MVVQVLKQAVLCRTTNFDLLEANGWETLCEDIAEDFPHLTLAELSGIIKDGYKGKLDKYKSLPLNYTRIYQWVASQATRQPSRLTAEYPELFAWAALASITDELVSYLLRLEASTSQGLNISVVKNAIRQTMEGKYYPSAANPDAKTRFTGDEIRAHQAEYARIQTELLPQFAAQYPEFAAKHGAMMY